MKRRRCAVTMARLILASIPLWILLLGLYSLFQARMDSHFCQMTFMRPLYIPIPVEGHSTVKYKLYAYLENDLALPREDLDWIQRKNRRAGLPVLFLPGNAGSFKQIRSLASQAAYDYANAMQHLLPMDFYSIDTNEELTALHARSLIDQALFVNAIIPVIQQLYLNHPGPVLIMAHSMGGIVARTLPAVSNFIPDSLQLVFTLATPHIKPPVMIEWRMRKLYDQIDLVWRAGLRNETDKLKLMKPLDSESYFISQERALNRVQLVSLAPGMRDTMVNSESSIIGQGFVPETRGLTVWTTAMPHVWTCMDHQAVLWCRQLILSLSQCLYQWQTNKNLNHFNHCLMGREVKEKEMISPYDFGWRSCQLTGGPIEEWNGTFTLQNKALLISLKKEKEHSFSFTFTHSVLICESFSVKTMNGVCRNQTLFSLWPLDREDSYLKKFTISEKQAPFVVLVPRTMTVQWHQLVKRAAVQTTIETRSISGWSSESSFLVHETIEKEKYSDLPFFQSISFFSSATSFTQDFIFPVSGLVAYKMKFYFHCQPRFPAVVKQTLLPSEEIVFHAPVSHDSTLYIHGHNSGMNGTLRLSVFADTSCLNRMEMSFDGLDWLGQWLKRYAILLLLFGYIHGLLNWLFWYQKSKKHISWFSIAWYRIRWMPIEMLVLLCFHFQQTPSHYLVAWPMAFSLVALIAFIFNILIFICRYLILPALRHFNTNRLNENRRNSDTYRSFILLSVVGCLAPYQYALLVQFLVLFFSCISNEERFNELFHLLIPLSYVTCMKGASLSVWLSQVSRGYWDWSDHVAWWTLPLAVFIVLMKNHSLEGSRLKFYFFFSTLIYILILLSYGESSTFLLYHGGNVYFGGLSIGLLMRRRHFNHKIE